MSNNVQTIKAMYEAFGRGDIPFIMSHLDENVVWESEGPEIISFAGIHHGHAGALRFFQAIAKDHENIKLDMPVIFADGDHVAAFGRYSVTMKATGKPADTPLAHFWTFRNGKVTRYVNYSNTAAYVEALS